MIVKQNTNPKPIFSAFSSEQPHRAAALCRLGPWCRKRDAALINLPAVLIANGLGASLMLTTGARAQKRIDDVVDRLSLIGKATYTSTLVRDPKTRRVRTIVRELSVTSAPQLGHTLKEAFREETKNATRSTQKQEKGTFQQWLTFENKSRESVYRLSVEASGAAEVTIVVKIK